MDDKLMEKFLSHFKPLMSSVSLRLAFTSADIEGSIIKVVLRKLLTCPGLNFSLDKHYDFSVEPYTTLTNVVGIVISARADIGCGTEAVRKILFVPLNDVTSYRFKSEGEIIYTVPRDAAMIYFNEMVDEQDAAKEMANQLIDRIKNQPDSKEQ